MTHAPSASTTRRLLTALAIPPDGEPFNPAERTLHETVEEIHHYLSDPGRQSVSTDVLHRWRTTLDHCHTALERSAPAAGPV